MTVQVYGQKERGRDLKCNCFLSPPWYTHMARKAYIDDLSGKLWEIIMGGLCSLKFGYLHLTFLPQSATAISQDSVNKVSGMTHLTLKQTLKKGQINSVMNNAYFLPLTSKRSIKQLLHMQTSEF